MLYLFLLTYLFRLSDNKSIAEFEYVKDKVHSKYQILSILISYFLCRGDQLSWLVSIHSLQNKLFFIRV